MQLENVDKLIEPRQQHEDDFAYIIRVQKLYNFNIWIYTPCGNGKIELFNPVDDFNKDRKDVRILVWSNGQIEHCALIIYRNPVKYRNPVRTTKKTTLNTIIVIGVPIGLTHKLNTTKMKVTPLSIQRLFVPRKNILLL